MGFVSVQRVFWVGPCICSNNGFLDLVLVQMKCFSVMMVLNVIVAMHINQKLNLSFFMYTFTNLAKVCKVRVKVTLVHRVTQAGTSVTL